ncbi:dihydrofolate synthase [Lewinellaceae bacterium SD302]|nr:dihydrofolate synthase [Lewinellaceae bacterium SD302]
MTYEETTDWLFTQLPVYQRQGAAAMKKDLTNIRLLLAELGNPHEKLRCVHIGGTNGKGTVAHLIAAALQSNGHSVGLYTSPHYLDFRERIKINGLYISKETVVERVNYMQDMIARIRPSFFEITVALAFDYFAAQKVDWAVIEVGLGGRLDSTNVIDPVLSVITNISKDHTQFLGDTLPEIAREKAGIIKPGRPVVIGETQLETEGVFREVANQPARPDGTLEEGAVPIYFADRLWSPGLADQTLTHSYLNFAPFGQENYGLDYAIEETSPQITLNATTAFCALQILHGQHGYQLLDHELLSAWTNLRKLTGLMGRWQYLSHRPRIIVDSAHNEGGLRSATEKLKALADGPEGEGLHIVLGVVNDKDLTTVLPLFPKAASYYFVQASIERALPAGNLAAVAAQYGLLGKVYSSVEAGLEVAKATASQNEVIYVGGSIFTAAEVL